MFIGTADDRYLRPHAFYQVHRITGKTVATASQEIIIASTKVLEIPLLPENNMSARYLPTALHFNINLDSHSHTQKHKCTLVSLSWWGLSIWLLFFFYVLYPPTCLFLLLHYLVQNEVIVLVMTVSCSSQCRLFKVKKLGLHNSVKYTQMIFTLAYC